ncbi:hypothetical protein LUZ60_016899 [Juncus effusus]|nr:hypothetical protein LUZ60_016899 [Juncus effusus]
MAQTGADQEGVDWADLHQDLLHLISGKLPDITDVLRLLRVCNRWRRAFPEFYLSFPWILQYRSGFEPELHFFSLYYNKIYTFNLGEQKSGTPISMSYPAKNFLNLSPSGSTQNQRNIAVNSSHPVAPLHPINRSQIIIPPPPREFYRVAMMEPYNKKTGEYGIFLENILYEHKAGRLDSSKDWIFKDEIYNGNGCAYFKGRYFMDSQTEGTKIIDISVASIKKHLQNTNIT